MILNVTFNPSLGVIYAYFAWTITTRMENVLTLVWSVLFFYLMVVVGSSTGVQAGKKSFGLLLHTSRGWHGQE